MRVGMVATKIAVETRGALDGPGRALVEGDALREKARRDEAIEMAFRCLEAFDIGDKFNAEGLERLAEPRPRRRDRDAFRPARG